MDRPCAASQPDAVPAAAKPAKENVFLRLLPITSAVFIGFLTIGLALPVLPLHVHDTLHLSAFVVGLVMGGQFAAALLSRVWAGGYADTKGAKRAVAAGFIVAILAGVVYAGSLSFLDRPQVSVGILLLGRFLLGCAESFVVTGALGWGVGLVGPQNAGKVMAWVGMAMYGAYAVGAPVGTALYGQNGFMAVAIATILISLLALMVILPVAPVAPPAARRTPFYKVVGAVWLPGVGLVCASVGLGAVTAFIALQFAVHSWAGASLALTIFGAAFIAARLLFGGLPDRLGGARVALVCVLIEAAGQAIIWSAPTALVAYVGATLTGFGYSLAFPSFGVEAVRRAPPQSRGVAMGAYVAFMDLSLGIAGPALGFVASRDGVPTVYLTSAIIVLCAIPVAVPMIMNRAAAAR